MTRIAQVTGLAERPHVVRRALEVLERLELVARERNFDAPPKAPWRHYISDNAVRFWYHFVQPNRSGLETGQATSIWKNRVEPHLDQYMGKAFESMIREAFTGPGSRRGWPAATEWARWEGRDRNRRSIEIDIVARLEDGKILTGEVKWSSSPVDTDVYTRLIRNLEDLSASGQGWANDALSADRSAGHVYVSAAGFTDTFETLAADEDRITLLSLEDLYALAAPFG